jgi:hypothetical protein
MVIKMQISGPGHFPAFHSVEYVAAVEIHTSFILS